MQLRLFIPPRRLGLCGPLIRHLPEEPALGVGPGDVQGTFRGGEGGDDVGAFGDGFARGFLGVFEGCALWFNEDERGRGSGLVVVVMT